MDLRRHGVPAGRAGRRGRLDERFPRAYREDAELAFTFFQAMPIPYVEPEDVANLALFLASDESRFITGQQIGIDGGALIKARRGAGL